MTKQKWNRLRSKEGFSLVELMVVVAIIGILAGLAMPKFNLFQAKARQAEVKSNLSQIYTLQLSYYGDNSAYVAFANVNSAGCTGGNVLGFVPSPCGKLRYSYSSVGTTTFTATGDGAVATLYPGCSNTTARDTWTIDTNRNLTQTNDGFKGC